ncbi:hypothetical protein DFA_12280 [Cavenderia fasciculata]|uniref:EGF-like domain-containing protein n=1 Tax=Cavenderia fasciculata TaxID=261658 RepID=F4QCY0_CACFS|nr:uncharacterized protein DFA_12280 [Cavenderia fasciculata]EGG14504.1 hypothetical protein DFA_12280 [Cavenderia fasciculata]|eukprot:XP_004353913.1 hypothetical protein DFA_12280 [Cavenderia fasciculata]
MKTVNRSLHLLLLGIAIIGLMINVDVLVVQAQFHVDILVKPQEIYGSPWFDGASQTCTSYYNAQSIGANQYGGLTSPIDINVTASSLSCTSVQQVPTQLSRCDFQLRFDYPATDPPQKTYTITFIAESTGLLSYYDIPLICSKPNYIIPTLLNAYSNLSSIVVNFKGDSYSRTPMGAIYMMTPYIVTVDNSECYAFAGNWPSNVTKGSNRYDTSTYTFVLSVLVDPNRVCDFSMAPKVTVTNSFAPTTITNTFTLPIIKSGATRTLLFSSRTLVSPSSQPFNNFVTQSTNLVTLLSGATGSQIFACTDPTQRYPVNSYNLFSFPVLGHPLKMGQPSTYLTVDPILDVHGTLTSSLTIISSNVFPNISIVPYTLAFAPVIPSQNSGTVTKNSVSPFGKWTLAFPVATDYTGLGFMITTNTAERCFYRVVPSIPYGIINGTRKEADWMINIYLPNSYFTSSENILASFIGRSTTSFSISNGAVSIASPMIIDNTAPIVSSIQIQPISSNRLMVTVKAIDGGGSGLLRIICGLVVTAARPLVAVDLTESNLISGSIYDGTWQGYLDLDNVEGLESKLSNLKCSAIDQALNQALYFAGNFFPLEANLSFSRFDIPTNIDMIWLAEDFTYFQFKYQTVDVTNVNINNTLWFNVQVKPGVSLANIRPVLKIKCFRTLRSIQELSFEGLWNPNAQLFQIDFTIPMNIYQGDLQYSIKSFPDIDFTSLLSKFPQNASIYVISSYGDLYPPMITDLKTDFIQDNNNDLTAKWTFTITDQPNGLDYAIINITSDMDYRVRSFTIRPQDAVSGDAYSGVYTISFITQCVNEVFTLSWALTKDRSFNYGISPSLDDSILNYNTHAVNLNYINPLEGIDPSNLTRKSACGDHGGQGMTPPTIPMIRLSFSQFYPGRPSLNYFLNFTVTSVDGVSPEHPPFVYIQSLHGYHLKIPTVGAPITNTEWIYNATFKMPFGFGHKMSSDADYPFIVSVYGATSIYKISSGFTSPVNIPRNMSVQETTVMPSYYPSKVYSNGGHNLTIYVVAGISGGVMSGECKHGAQVLKSTSVTPTSITFQLVPPFTPLPSTITCYALIMGVQTNSITIPVITPVYTLPSDSQGGGGGNGNTTNQCYQTGCSGNGDCTSNGCICSLGYSGTTCEKQTITVPTNISQTAPETISQEDQKLKSIISIAGVRELDINGAVINEFMFTSNKSWTWTNNTSTTQPNGSPLMYTSFGNNSNINVYNTTISTDRKTSLTVVIEQFNDFGIVGFANQNLTMQPGTVKYFIGMDSYEFESTLNTLQLLVSINVESLNQDNDCGGTLIDYGTNSQDQQSNSNVLNWIKFKVDDRTLYGRFINTGIVDYRIIQVSNVLLPQQQQGNDNSTSALIALNIPNYSNQIYLDPDFSYLIDTRDECGGGGGLKTAQIIGIAIGCAAALLIATLAVVYIVKRKYSIRFDNGKIKMVTVG